MGAKKGLNTFLAWGCLFLMIGAADSAAQDAFQPYTGEVTADDVYARSGPGENYYPVTKLAAGSFITVTGQKHGWLSIIPPEGCFSLIDKNYVDLTPGNTGVLNGNYVWVRAGSDLSKNHYAKQVKLHMGAEITIQGETETGFYKIAPPEGAQVWISEKYIGQARDNVVKALLEPSKTEVKEEAPPTPRQETIAAVPEEVVPTQTDTPIEDARYMSPPANTRLDEQPAETPVVDMTPEPDVTIEEESATPLVTDAAQPSPVPTPQPVDDTPPATTDETRIAALQAESQYEVAAPVDQPTTTEQVETKDEDWSEWPANTFDTKAADDAQATMPEEQEVPAPEEDAVAEQASPPPAPVKEVTPAAPAIDLEVYAKMDPYNFSPQVKSYESMIQVIEGDLEAEFRKPISQRDVGKMIAGFQKISQQEHDIVSALYAERRVQQLLDVQEKVNALREISSLTNKVAAERNDSLKRRSAIRPIQMALDRRFDVEGEMRPSMIYDSPVGPRRFRLVDPRQDIPRTVAYVEIPRGSTIDPHEYLGRYVGVRASNRFFQEGTVDPISVYVVSEITILEQPANDSGMNQASALPSPNGTLASGSRTK